MITDWIQAIAATAQALLIPAAVIFAALQWRESAKQTQRNVEATKATVYQGINEQLQSIGMSFLAYPELRPYFYQNREPNSHERQRIEAMSIVFIDFMDGVVTQSSSIPHGHMDIWDRYFNDMFASSPALRNFWRKYSSWYHPDLRNILYRWTNDEAH